MYRTVIALTFVMANGACTSSPYLAPTETYSSAQIVSAEPASLFSGDAEILSDESIARILDHDYRPPQRSRVALMPFGQDFWFGWSEELTLSSDELKAQVLDKLRGSVRVAHVSYLPSILIPEKRSVPYLREAAARYQADMLLVYRSQCSSFEKYRLFRADESRAFCSVEAVLVDTRTGLVPFTSTANRTFDVEKKEGDFSLRETQLKAQMKAITSALAEVAEASVSFLEDG